MDPLPHTYRTAIETEPEATDVIVRSAGLPDLSTNAPSEYGGPGDRWSPETLLMAAVADCYVLSFRAIARASELTWSNLGCEVTGTLDKDGKVVRFVAVSIRARASVAPNDRSRAERILQKAKETCLVTNSLSASIDFAGEVTTTG